MNDSAQKKSREVMPTSHSPTNLADIYQRLALIEHLALTPDQGFLYWYQHDLRFLLTLIP